MGAAPALSYSSIRAYLECPLRWRFLYVDRLPEAPRGYFSFGRTVHAVLEAMIRPLVEPADRRAGTQDRLRTLDDWGRRRPGDGPGLVSPEALLRLYDAEWISEGYASADEEARYRSLGADLLLRYRDAIAESPPRPVAVEAHLEAEWEGVRIHGYLDRIDRTPNGGLEVVDYKTTRELSREDAATSDQLALYQVLVERNFPDPVEGLTLYHLRSLTALKSPPRDADDLGRLFDRVGLASDGIRTQAFDPTPGRHCGRCEFKDRCPEFREVPGPDRARLAQLVDRFQALREEERRLDGALADAAEALHREAERLGVHRLEGPRGTAVRRREETWQFPPDRVGPILATAGLAERIDPADVAQVRRLLRDARVPPDVRARVEGTGGRSVRWYWVVENGGTGAASPRG